MIESLRSNAGQAADIMDRGKDTSEQGVAKAAEAGEALVSITEAVTVINSMNTQIVNASEEQSAVAVEMDGNIINIRRAAEENTEGSNQLVSSGSSLNDLSMQMQQLVGRFKV